MYQRIRFSRTFPIRLHRARRSAALTTTPKSRRGHTLIELLVVITVLSAVLVLTGSTFYFLMRSEKLVSQSLVTERSIASLANQFREDVHQSISSEPSDRSADATTELMLRGTDQSQVRYRATKGGLTRFQVEDDKAVAREDYRLPDCRVSFEYSRDSNVLFRSLVIDRPGSMIMRNSHASVPLRALRIEASVVNEERRSAGDRPEAAANKGTDLQAVEKEQSK